MLQTLPFQKPRNLMIAEGRRVKIEYLARALNSIEKDVSWEPHISFRVATSVTHVLKACFANNCIINVYLIRLIWQHLFPKLQINAAKLIELVFALVL